MPSYYETYTPKEIHAGAVRRMNEFDELPQEVRDIENEYGEGERLVRHYGVDVTKGILLGSYGPPLVRDKSRRLGRR